MKKIILFILLCGISTQIRSQNYVNIPDPIFRAYIDSIVPGAIVGNNLNTQHPGLQSVTGIMVDYMGIADLTGVQYFTNLGYLYCTHNYLQSFPPLPFNLYFLFCDYNQLNSLPALPPNLTDLRCGYNYLSTLPALPNSIGTLYCNDNGLISLPALPQNLTMLYCSHNLLTAFPALPQNLYNLYCANNQLTNLPSLPNSLNYLGAAGNPDLWCLPNIPNNGNFSSDIGYLVCTPQGTPGAWYKMANNPFVHQMSTSFSIGSKCYLATGSSNFGNPNDLWEFNPSTNVWTQKANVPGQTRIQATSFSIGNKGYVGLGQGSNPVALRDLWEYNPVTNTWLQKANYPDSAFFGNAAFSIGNKGYVGCGQRSGNVFPQTFYEFDPLANTWTSKANFPGFGRTQAACFTIGNKGYVCGGDWSNGLTNTCYSYNPLTNAWSSIAPLPQNINECASFSVNGKGYVAGGQCCFYNGLLVSTLMEYDAILNSWTQRADIPALGRFRTAGCATNGRGYVGSGTIYTNTGSTTNTNDWWEYTPLCATPSNVIYASGNLSFCNGDSVMLYADNGNNYQWKKNGNVIAGANSQYYYAKTGGTFTCVISNACDTVASNQISVTVNPSLSAAITPNGPTTFCSGGSVTLNAVVAVNRIYQWKKNGAIITGATSPSYVANASGTYKVSVTNTVTGCSKTGAGIVVTKNALPTATVTAQGPTTFCAGGSVVLAANTGAGLTYKWKKGTNYIAGASASNYTATTAGTYKVEVTNSNGCTKTSSGVVVSVPCKEGEELISSNDFNVTVNPNPSSADFAFEIENESGEINSVTIFDVIGKIVLSETNIDANFIIHDSQLLTGVYSVVITDGNERKVIKIVKTQ